MSLQGVGAASMHQPSMSKEQYTLKMMPALALPAPQPKPGEVSTHGLWSCLVLYGGADPLHSTPLPALLPGLSVVHKMLLPGQLETPPLSRKETEDVLLPLEGDHPRTPDGRSPEKPCLSSNANALSLPVCSYWEHEKKAHTSCVVP